MTAVFLLIAATSLASVSKSWKSRGEVITAAAMIAVHLATGMLAAGFVAGWIVYFLLGIRKKPRAS